MTYLSLRNAALGTIWLTAPSVALASAQPGESVKLSYEMQDLPYDSEQHTVSLEYQYSDGDTTVVFTPVYGQRITAGGRSSAFGVGATIYQELSDTFSSRTEAFISEPDPVFARYDVTQEFTAKIANKTTASLGLRWAQYAGGTDVLFASAGVRRYFKRGSIAYRATLVDAEGRKAFLAHLASVTINDPEGAGKTQLWLSAGAANTDQQLTQNTFNRGNYGGVIMRTQPLTEDFSVLLKAGVTSYALPTDRETGATVGLGLKYRLD